jgi:hypothetical protein
MTFAKAGSLQSALNGKSQITIRAQALRPYKKINANRNHYHHLLVVLNLL